MDRSGAEDAAELLDAFLRAVSHDLKSPLLTISLSNELLGDAASLQDERAVAAREALGEGVHELERMLNAVTAISRARRRPLDPQPVGLGDFRVSVDPATLAELRAAIGSKESDVRLDGAGDVCLTFSLPAEMQELEGSPLRLLATSLQDQAGTAVEGIAAAEVLLGRQGGSVTLGEGRLLVRLPPAD